jgi:hypothetical protein
MQSKERMRCCRQRHLQERPAQLDGRLSSDGGSARQREQVAEVLWEPNKGVGSRSGLDLGGAQVVRRPPPHPSGEEEKLNCVLDAAAGRC